MERNDVLEALGIPELHHAPRFVFRHGLVHLILARRPPAEIAAFGDSIGSFMGWLSDNDPNAFAYLWPDGHFNYSREAALTMGTLVTKWRHREEAPALQL